MRAEFQKDFSAPTAGANGVAGGATLLNNPADQSTVRMLLTDPSEQNVNGSNGVAGLFLNLSATTFQPVFEDPLGVAVNSGQASVACLPGSGPMSALMNRVTRSSSNPHLVHMLFTMGFPIPPHLVCILFTTGITHIPPHLVHFTMGITHPSSFGPLC